jgi:hypothetical protein
MRHLETEPKEERTTRLMSRDVSKIEFALTIAPTNVEATAPSGKQVCSREIALKF